MISNNETEHLNTSDKRNSKGRFGWVKRLMQGQRQSNGEFRGSVDVRQSGTIRESNINNRNSAGFSRTDQGTRSMLSNGSSFESEVNSNNMEIYSNSDQSNIDNLSTIPLKSIVSVQSTKSPSILSEQQHDQNSFVASTAETSLAPSTNNNLAPLSNNVSVQERERERERDRDSESIVTLASSSRRVRRRSFDTNSSTTGIPPSSIMERLGHPAASTYAVSIRTNERNEPSQSSINESTNDQSTSNYNETTEATK